MGNLNNLPEDILLDIITRLPTESILDCKLVCKPWRNLVSHHPSFFQLHLTHSADSGKSSFIFESQKQLYYFEYTENNDETPTHRIRRININPPIVLPSYMVIGSVNGLVCLYGRVDQTACVCNPVTKEYVMIPKLNKDFDRKYIHWSSGFGHLPSTNKYKVVEMYKIWSNLNIVEVAVYTLGSGNGWRSVGRFDIEFCYFIERRGVFVNGSLHRRDKQEGRILAFDLTEEKFSDEHLSPPLLPYTQNWDHYTLGEMGGVLYCAIEYYHHIKKCSCFDMWLLKDTNYNIHYMKEQLEHKPFGWSRVFSLPGKQPLAFTKSGGVLCYDHTSIYIRDAKASTSRKLVDDFSAFSQILSYENTLVSLKELGEGDIKVMESAEIEET